MLLTKSSVVAQDVSAEVLSGFGSSFTNQNRTFDSSIGELAVSTFTVNGISLTQGFLQPISLKIPCGDVTLKAFPNPVISGLRIYAEGCNIEVSVVRTYDLFGKLVLEGRVIDNQINFSSIGVGVYLVRVYDSNENEVGVVKILKSTI